MKHEWQLVRKTQATFLKPEERVCEHCGARQELVIEQAWMRVVGRRWLPLVGRCKPSTLEGQVMTKKQREIVEQLIQASSAIVFKTYGNAELKKVYSEAVAAAQKLVDAKR